uniref:SFRICE_006439 n=1 Tax=Spodoptera frugiperda TaxID=7108 RepID=A0A2H1V4R9_SPOFR
MSVCRVVLVCVCLCACMRACSGAYSSFWAPLYDRRLLNYRVDAAFDPDSARQGREQYAARYGYRGERLIADIGNGKGLTDEPRDTQMYGDVTFQYT